MDRYDYATVSDSEIRDRVTLTCTNTEELEALMLEINRKFPKMRSACRRDSIDASIYYYMIWDLSNCEEGTKWWVIKQLCSHGWEPIGAVGEGRFTNLTHQFRRKL